MYGLTTIKQINDEEHRRAIKEKAKATKKYNTKK